MYVITVEFEIHSKHIAEFLPTMRKQAQNSLALESECHCFDVALAEDNPNSVFLYEIYTDRAAFEAHLASDHFKSFNTKVATWVKSKSVKSWHREKI